MTDIKPDLAITDLPDASPSDPLEALSWLGETVEEVVKGLRARGIKGRQKSPYHCPLHNYLFAFGWDYAVTGQDVRHIDNVSGKYEKAQPCLDYFVEQFDAGYFPDLIDNG